MIVNFEKSNEFPVLFLMRSLFLIIIIMTTHSVFGQEFQLYDPKPKGSEDWNWQEGKNNKNSMRVMTVYNVTQPTLTLFRPVKTKATGAAIIVCPGGGFHFLAIDHEGTTVAKVLAELGITVFVLKYRLVHINSENPFDDMLTAPDPKAWDDEAIPIIPLAVDDARNAIGYVRRHAAEFGIKEDRIGVMGFSAGGLVAASVAFNYTAENRPDFVVPVYADFAPERVGMIRTDSPPVYIVCSQDDEFGFVAHAVNLYQKLTEAKRPVELHLLSKGGHGFGVGMEGTTTYQWLNKFGFWLESRKLLK
ncbi:MAG TPA: alpha/beta hydrolase [Chryseosolibacter sp.]